MVKQDSQNLEGIMSMLDSIARIVAHHVSGTEVPFMTQNNIETRDESLTELMASYLSDTEYATLLRQMDGKYRLFIYDPAAPDGDGYETLNMELAVLPDSVSFSLPTGHLINKGAARPYVLMTSLVRPRDIYLDPDREPTLSKQYGGKVQPDRRNFSIN